MTNRKKDKKGEIGSTKHGSQISGKLAITTMLAAAAIFMAGLLPSTAHGMENSPNPGMAGMGNMSAPGRAKPVGNEICPVSGEKINPKHKVSYEYKGRIYNFCCTDCLKLFKKDPEKYISRMKKGGTGAASPKKPSH